MSLFRCPVCGAPLDRGERAYTCPNRHSYDLARAGYAYLLPPNQKHSSAPGDDRQMAQARREFLSKGYYEPLLKTLCCQILSLCGESPVILDAGCGEGYYTAGIFQALGAAGRTPRMAGTDISKFILRAAARRERGVEFAVASSYHLPLADGAVDLLLDCFSPLALEEFWRVLRPGGWFLYVVPGPEHLWEMKEILYEKPYPNEEKETPYEGFTYERIVPVDGTATLPDQTDIQNLFRMTPYFWKTPRAGAERLAALDRLEVDYLGLDAIDRRILTTIILLLEDAQIRRGAAGGTGEPDCHRLLPRPCLPQTVKKDVQPDTAVRPFLTPGRASAARGRAGAAGFAPGSRSPAAAPPRPPSSGSPPRASGPAGSRRESPQLSVEIRRYLTLCIYFCRPPASRCTRGCPAPPWGCRRPGPPAPRCPPSPHG